MIGIVIEENVYNYGRPLDNDVMYLSIIVILTSSLLGVKWKIPVKLGILTVL